MEHVIQALGSVFAIQTLLFIFIGVAVGILFGAVPGLTAVMAVALFLPVTYGMSPGVGISILIALYIGATSGGLISAILLKIPGTPSSVATCFDGHPMMEKGEGPKALGVGIVFSFVGTILSILALMLVAPNLAKVAIKFGPHEYFAIAIFSLTLIAALSGKSMIKGIFAGVLGIAFGTVGIAPVDAAVRFTFGTNELKGGFNTLTVLVGLFAISEVIKTAEKIKSASKDEVAQVSMKSIKGFGFSWKEFREQLPNCGLSSLLGVCIGILPGIGAATSNIVAYTVSKKRSKRGHLYGTGVIDGIVASESANNAGIGGALIPLMTLGIPGDAVTAILLGGFMLHGIQPGPLLFTNNATLVYTIFIAMIVSSVAMLILEFYGLRIFSQLLNVPKHLLLPIILVLCVVGAFGINSRVFDVWTILVFGLVGYLFVKFKAPHAPFIMGFILGPMAETNLRRGLMFSEGKFSGFLTNPISGTFLVLALASIVWSAASHYRNSRRDQEMLVVEDEE
ncbi:tripartite tricarboxylate transporter permease [Anaerotalea alkaliphila]|uniref:Tat pathway signal protein n=1 Tax=Anaerotalea alkaliphila TaxID=2662126 RepID=A0A7X5HVF6_9FIRM|nr:tripartite tricarboxylate transporter permease [Anaerotalea alkaliphila]NDL67370.1 Tat pathway signal protein [Anaerotalea alkaliphila]